MPTQLSARLIALLVSYAACVVGAAETAVAQSNATAPTLSLVGAAFDEARERLVIVGGYSAAAAHAETWEWDGTRWRNIAASGPSPRNEPLLVYDRKRKRIVLYGGDRDRETPATDTWSWDGVKWQQLATDGPSPRATSMVYDAKRDRIVLFGGGSNTGALFNDTWEWNGARWERVLQDSLSGNPPARALHGLAYDESRGRVILTAGFGGFNTTTRTPTTFNDTWGWDGSKWHQVNVPGPGARDHVSMVYAPDRRAIVLHGGGMASTGLQGDSWLYDGATWSRIQDGGPARGRHRLVYDTKNRAILLYGGWAPENRQMTELWSLTGNQWTRLSPGR